MTSDDHGMVISAEDVPRQPVADGTGVTKQVLIGPERAPNFFLRRFSFEPGGGIPRHTNQVEHEQYVLRGRAKVGIGDAVYEVKAGDVVFIPKAVPHWYRTEGDEPFVILCAVPNLPDRMELLENR
ncbi:MAG: cupin domain-containing protein [Verrucomicrobia bacterium]|nr:cupin domain-containing protein [Verrucomicrobiota bacterium]